MGPRRLTDGGFKPGSPALWPWGGGRLILTAGSNPMLWEQPAVVLGDVSWDPVGGRLILTAGSNPPSLWDPTLGGVLWDPGSSHTDGGFKPAVVWDPTRGGGLILTAGSNPPSLWDPGTSHTDGGFKPAPADLLSAGSNPQDPVGGSHTDGGFKPAVVMGPPWRGSHTDRGFKPAVVKPSKRTPWTRSRY